MSAQVKSFDHGLIRSVPGSRVSFSRAHGYHICDCALPALKSMITKERIPVEKSFTLDFIYVASRKLNQSVKERLDSLGESGGFQGLIRVKYVEALSLSTVMVWLFGKGDDIVQVSSSS
ncbi:hypothetical protein TNCV_891271 [Trichonephila clavipes]|nr:hypothetical protein TNCV_891271 [Trichonephila clavipes]